MAEAAGLALGGVALVPLIKQTYDLCHTFRHAPEELREHAQTVQPLAQILDIVKEIVEKATSNPEGYPQWQRFLRAAGETISNTDATVKALQFMCNGNGVSSTPGKFKIRGRFQWTLKNKNKVAEYLERLSACRNDLNVILNANLVLHQWDLMDLAKRTRQTVTTSTGEMSDAASRIVADLAEIRPAMQRNNEEVSSLVGTAYMMQEMLRQIHGTIDDLRNPTVHPQKVLISVGVGTCDERGVTSSSQEMSTVEPWAGSAADSLNDDFHTGTQIASRNPNRTFASDDANVSALEGEDQKTRDFPLTLLPRIRATSTTIYAE
ncbi:hypothetical protein MMC08_008111, partial [Hypocenomyce scalaris]|nr:hypothetical protein [Hypocenomyce scalaris]